MDATSAGRLRRRLAAGALGVALAAAAGPAGTQTLLQDFYSQSGLGQANVTSPGVYQSAGLNTITGGGLVYKAPSRQFFPYYISPPRLRAGCGGIDVFTGAFSLPSKDEFVAFLRSIGQDIAGLAFQLALQSLAPDLAAQVQDFRDLITRYTGRAIDSCETAKALLENVTGQKFQDTQVNRTKNRMRAAGDCRDEAACVELTKADMGTVLANCQAVTNSDGRVEEACEMNVLWALMQSGSFSSVPTELRELAMSVLGSRIHRRSGNGPDAVIEPVQLEWLLHADDLVGTVDAPVLQGVQRWQCDEPVYCLNPTRVPYTERGMARWVYDIAKRYHRAILDRVPEGGTGGVTREEMYQLASATSIPIVRVINAVSYNRFAFVADDVIRVFSEAAAYELALRFLESLLKDVEKLAVVKETNAQTKYVAEYAELLKRDIRGALREVRDRSQDIQQKMIRMGSMVTFVEHIERSLKTTMAADLAANLRFGAR